MEKQHEEDFCLHCSKKVKPAWGGDMSEAGHAIHRLLTFLTCGFWGGVWFLSHWFREGKYWRCPACKSHLG